MNPRINSIENLIACDPGGRNIFSLLVADQLRRAAASLISARRVGIVSGFYIPEVKAGETDGPPGAAVLGQALQKLDIPVDFITDEWNAPLFRALSIEPVIDVSHYLQDEKPTHLVAIERIGRCADGHYRNMLGRDITSTTPPLDELFLEAQRQEITTIGIGDGGNEIGMGKVFADTLEHIQHGREIATIVSTDLCIAAGVSNWGAYGLAGAMSVLTGRDLLPDGHEAANIIERIVQDGRAVDGVTHRNEPTVDGIPLSASIQMLESIRRQIAPSPLSFSRPILVGILGYGETGRAAATLLLHKGHRVRVSDRADIDIAIQPEIEAMETGKHSIEFLQDCDLVIASPGVHPKSPILEQLHRRGIAVMSEMELAYQLCDRKLIAVTGTVGKRTTVKLMQHLFQHAGRSLWIGGNKGQPLSALLTDDEDAHPIAVAVSSFQLEHVVHFCPQVAVILNIDQAHLDRHQSIAEYIRIKSRVFMNQGPDTSSTGEPSCDRSNALILPYDDLRLRTLADKHRGTTWFISANQEVERGAWISNGCVMINVAGTAGAIGPVPEQKMIMNYPENLLSSILTAKLFGLSDDELAAALASLRE